MDVFAQRRTSRRAAVLGVSQLVCLGPRTITGLLSVAGKQDADWTADYRFFSQDRWNPQQLFDSILQGVLDFLPPDRPVVCAMDDTLLRKTGAAIPDVAYRRDPLSPAFHTNFVRAQRFLQVSAMLPSDPQGPASARAIPIRYQPAPPLRKPSSRDSEEERQECRKLAKYYNLSTLGRDAIVATRQQLDRQSKGAAPRGGGRRWQLHQPDGAPRAAPSNDSHRANPQRRRTVQSPQAVRAAGQRPQTLLRPIRADPRRPPPGRFGAVAGGPRLRRRPAAHLSRQDPRPGVVAQGRAGPAPASGPHRAGVVPAEEGQQTAVPPAGLSDLHRSQHAAGRSGAGLPLALGH